MIYLANSEIIKEPIVLENLPQLESPVLSDIETGATVYLGTEFTVSNLPTGAKLYVNNVEQQGSTFTITPDASASTRNYLYTVNLQFKGVSGYVDSEIASYSFTVKNAAPTVNQNSQVTTSASLTVAISRTDTTYVTDLDVKYGVGADTTTGTSGTSVTITNTSVNSQYNFWINSTAYADKSDVVTKYYHVAESEKLPQPTISYDENNENFTINIASFPSDPDNGNYMSSTGYTIYYSLNSETIDTQYNNIAVSCNAGDVIRAKVSSSYGWQDSEVASYSVPVPAPEEMEMLNETFDNIDVSEDGYSDISSQLDNYTDNQGWTGSKVYTSPGGGVKIGSGTTAGNITSPDISMIDTDATLTVTVNAKQWSNSSGTINNTLLVELIGSGTVDEEGANEFILTGTAADYTVTFTNITTSTVGISITGGNRCYIYNVSAVSNEGSFAPTQETALWFDCEEGLEDVVGSEIEVGLYFGVRDSGEEVEVNDSENCTLSSDDESVATIEWYDQNEGEDEPLYVPKVTCIGEGICEIIAYYSVDGATYSAAFPLTVTAAE